MLQLRRPALAFLIMLPVCCAIAGCDKGGRPKEAAQTKGAHPEKLGSPVEDSLFTLAADRTYVHQKVSDLGNTVAFWVRRPHSVELMITGRPLIKFRGHMGFQQGLGFHAVEPREKGDRLIAGPKAEQDAWLVWGPGKGISGEPLDEYLLFDHRGDHVIYALYNHGRWCWQVDDSTLADCRVLRTPVVSDGAETVVWIDSSDGSERVVINGQPGPAYERIVGSSLSVSRDGRHSFYVGIRSGKARAVRDGVPQAQYDNMSAQAVFSPDGARVAYYGRTSNKKECVVLDGVAGPEYDLVTAMTFSGDGAHFAYLVISGGSSFFVVDGTAQTSHFDKASDHFVFAPVGGRFAYAGTRGNSWIVVTDGNENSACAGVSALKFSQDGAHFAHEELGTDGKLHVFVDSEERWIHEGDAESDITFSANGLHVAYLIGRNSKCMAVLDGVEGPEMDRAGPPVISPDGGHIAYGGAALPDSSGAAIYLDGQMQQQFEVIASQLQFTDAGQLVYCGYRQKKWYLVMDGALGAPYDEIFLSHDGLATEGPDGSLVYIARRESTIVRIRYSRVSA
jgi:hypothetical protein